MSHSWCTRMEIDFFTALLIELHSLTVLCLVGLKLSPHGVFRKRSSGCHSNGAQKGNGDHDDGSTPVYDESPVFYDIKGGTGCILWSALLRHQFDAIRVIRLQLTRLQLQRIDFVVLNEILTSFNRELNALTPTLKAIDITALYTLLYRPGALSVCGMNSELPAPKKADDSG